MAGAQGLGDDEGISADEAKWQEILDQGVRAYLRDRPRRFHRRLQRGIPSGFRWRVWKSLIARDPPPCSSKTDERQTTPEWFFDDDGEQEAFAEVSARENPPWTAMIRTDIARTFPEDARFDHRQQLRLLHVLNAYAAYNPDLGYCQGMNFVVGMLLLVAGPDVKDLEIFQFLVALMHEFGLGLAGFYSDRLPLLWKYVRAHDVLVEEVAPDLRKHFLRENVQPPMYLHQWFLTLFVTAFPLSIVVIIWDAILLEGLPVLLRIGVSVLLVLRNHLLSMQMEEIIIFLRKMKTVGSDGVDHDLGERTGQFLVKRMNSVHISRELVEYVNATSSVPDEDRGWSTAESDKATKWVPSSFSRMLQWQGASSAVPPQTDNADRDQPDSWARNFSLSWLLR